MFFSQSDSVKAARRSEQQKLNSWEQPNQKPKCLLQQSVHRNNKSTHIFECLDSKEHQNQFQTKWELSTGTLTRGNSGLLVASGGFNITPAAWAPWYYIDWFLQRGLSHQSWPSFYHQDSPFLQQPMALSASLANVAKLKHQQQEIFMFSMSFICFASK